MFGAVSSENGEVMRNPLGTGGMFNIGYDYDLLVVGGGSGGITLAKESARLGKKVCLLDYVKPSPAGTTWGLGGTCVNVGCIPKKLFHQAALKKESLRDAKSFGWNLAKDDFTHDWSTFVQSVQDYIGSLNFGYRKELRQKGIKYENAYGTFVDKHTVQAEDKKGKIKKITADKIVICTGGRPRYPDIPGAEEHGITSDDMFSLQEPPGKTLIVGASYIALECAGFLKGLGYDTSVMVRSIFLRGFDQQMANLTVQYMEKEGVNFMRETVPTAIELNDEGKKVVSFKRTDGSEGKDVYDTVLFAVGREAKLQALNVEHVGIDLNPRNGKAIVNEQDQTSVSNIYAIGDCVDGVLELTPIAQQAGKYLARRLFDESKILMDYHNIPTTVFTPLEYSACGLSEEDAIAKYGEDDIEVYHSYFRPLEWSLPGRAMNDCYCKVICTYAEKADEGGLVVGIHFLGPNAGEVMQGFGTAMRVGATWHAIQDTVGIHPTSAEEITVLNISKRSGAEPQKSGC